MNLSDYRFNPKRVCGRVLVDPFIDNGRVQKGAVILSCPDNVLTQIPDLKHYYYVIERRGWNGMTDANSADIKFVEDPAKWEETKDQLPNALLLDVAGGDFVNTDLFLPLGIDKRYVGVQIARWCRLKRHDLFVRATSLLPDCRFLKFGNFYNGGTLEELALRAETIKLASDLGASIDFMYSDLINNFGFANEKEVNLLINLSMMGILTSSSEGNNRFKTECMSANIPVLVPADIVGGAAKKHINDLTGLVFDPTPEGLALAIRTVLSKYSSFSPRAYILGHTGMRKSTSKLIAALNVLADKEGLTPHFDNIYWDGREQTLLGYSQIYEHIRQSIESAKSNQ